MTDMDMPLPEPFDYCYEWDGPFGSRKFVAAQHNGRPPDRSVALYTADRIHARDAQWRAIVAAEVARERRRCAKICSDTHYTDYVPAEHIMAADYYREAALDCAAAIRTNPPISALDFGVPVEFSERAENYARWAVDAAIRKGE